MAVACTNVAVGYLPPLSCTPLSHLLEETSELAFWLSNFVVCLLDVGHTERLLIFGLLRFGSIENAEYKAGLQNTDVSIVSIGLQYLCISCRRSPRQVLRMPVDSRFPSENLPQVYSLDELCDV